MTDVVAAPQGDVVADAHEGLQDVVLEDEAVAADGDVAPDEGLGADIAGQVIAGGGAVVEQAPADPVELGIADGHEDVVGRGRIARRQVVQRDQRQALEGPALDVRRADGEGGDLVVAVVGEILVGHGGDLAVADDHQGLGLRHLQGLAIKRSSRRLAMGRPGAWGRT